MYYRQKILQVFSESLLSESILDKGILKAFILCGGPGAGKSFIVNKMSSELYPPPKILDADKLLEFKMKKRDLPLKWDEDQTTLTYKKQWKARNEALDAIEQVLNNHLNGYLSVIIDGTGQNVDKTLKRKKILEDLGYDVMMIMVTVPIELAQERNMKRERSIAPYMVEQVWNNVRSNIPTYKKLFTNYLEVDNGKDENGNHTLDEERLIRETKKFFNSPVQNTIGQHLIKHKDSEPMTRNVDVDLY
jgi:predicted kinase